MYIIYIYIYIHCIYISSWCCVYLHNNVSPTSLLTTFSVEGEEDVGLCLDAAYVAPGIDNKMPNIR